MSEYRRIAITGVGVVTSLGAGASAVFDRLVAGERGFAERRLFSLPDARSALAGEVALPASLVATAGSRTNAMAELAAREALAHAGLDPSRASCDLFTGGTTAGLFEAEDLLAAFVEDPSCIAPHEVLRSHPLGSTARHLHAAVGPFQAVRTVCSACSSGATALVLAAERIRLGLCDHALAGAADGLCKLTYSGFGALGALSREACRPFDRARAGLTLGEGAGYLVLESEEAAARRGARVLAWFGGGSLRSEAHHITNPDPSAAIAALTIGEAIRRAGVEPRDVGYVNAHGTATPLNDPMEVAALARAFGDHAPALRVSSSKGQVGHTLGAAAAIEAVFSVLAVDRGVAPPTVGLTEVDAACEGVRHLREAERADLRAVVSTSFGFGGADAAVVVASPRLAPRVLPASVPRLVLTGAAALSPAGLAHGASLARAPSLAHGVVDTALLPLDPMRARRVDRLGKMAMALVDAALTDACVTLDLRERTGLVMGSTFGSVEASCSYLLRLKQKGARLASPTEFPNLVPSSPGGHAAISAALKGPVLATGDALLAGERALATAVELVAGGLAERVVAGAVEETHPIIERGLGPASTRALERRAEGGGAVVVERADLALARGARVLADLAWVAHGPALSGLPPPHGRARVIVCRPEASVDLALALSAWARVPTFVLASNGGDHESLGAHALAWAAACLGCEELDQALVLGADRAAVSGALLVRHAGDEP
jgi:3-oxoacyl-[acyl-carrier-protein] synthase II